jgi:hypothetical protein
MRTRICMCKKEEQKENIKKKREKQDGGKGK